MTENTVAILRDQDGRIHYAARGSAFVQNGLASGELTDVEAERGTPTDAPTSDREDAKPSHRGSGHRAGDTTGADGH